MFIVRANRRRGFTLLEVIMAVAILATMALAIYRFVQSNIVAIRLSTQASAADARYDGLREVLTTQWQQVPPGRRAFSGDAFKVNDREQDEVRWVCSAGPGLMTRYAAGEFIVALRMQRAKNGSGYELGLLRKPKDDASLTNANETWVPLIQNVSSLEIEYLDGADNQWVQKWNESSANLPSLIRVTLQRSDTPTPWQAIIPLVRRPAQ
jgi:prepilin-type N-terminal cleavage/methylation domain-containing protein